ncbi:MAG TPA: HD domain-containing protein [Candidatus Limnocylindria bacterium]|jgi:putative nucleotidyltransferase with HDIG domain
MFDRVVQTWRYLAVARGDERHARRTAEILRSMGADADLVLAGELHDRAKPADTRLWHRIAAVLLDRLAPAVRERAARGEGTFARYLSHAARGAELARREGRPERVVRLIARHHATPRDADERMLARADREAMP